MVCTPLVGRPRCGAGLCHRLGGAASSRWVSDFWGAWYGGTVAGAKGGEGMGRAAAAEVRGGWVGMVLRVQASPDHAPAARAPVLGRPAGAVAPGGREIWWFPSTPFVQTASFPGNYRLKRLPTPQKVAAQELIRKLVSNCTLLCVCRGSCAPDPPSCYFLSFAGCYVTSLATEWE